MISCFLFTSFMSSGDWFSFFLLNFFLLLFCVLPWLDFTQRIRLELFSFLLFLLVYVRNWNFSFCSAFDENGNEKASLMPLLCLYFVVVAAEFRILLSLCWWIFIGGWRDVLRFWGIFVMLYWLIGVVIFGIFAVINF